MIRLVENGELTSAHAQHIPLFWELPTRMTLTMAPHPRNMLTTYLEGVYTASGEAVLCLPSIGDAEQQ